VTGLSGGTTVVLTNNGTDALTVNGNGNFTFPTKIDSGSAYNVAVQSNPTGETCTPSSASGTITSSGPVTNVAVSCVANLSNYNSVSGTVSGLATGTSVVLTNNGSSSVTVSTNGAFSFPTQLLVGTQFSITVTTQPTGRTCTATPATGAVPIVGASTSIVVSCV